MRTRDQFNPRIVGQGDTEMPHLLGLQRLPLPRFAQAGVLHIPMPIVLPGAIVWREEQLGIDERRPPREQRTRQAQQLVLSDEPEEQQTIRLGQLAPGGQIRRIHQPSRKPRRLSLSQARWKRRTTSHMRCNSTGRK